MVDSRPPDPPMPAAELPPEDQADVLLNDYLDAMAWGAREAQMRQVLIDYIKQVKEWYERSR